MAQFDDLRQTIKGAVITPQDADYKAAIKRWSHAAVRPAAVVVQPDDTEQVSLTVKYATSRKIPFVVSSGGHATSGSSSIDGGMVIDLRRLNSTHVDAEKKLITFGGGCKWKDIDVACAEHGLATVGGTVNHTGVGGLILGGGFGWLTPKYGLTIDQLVSAEVVLADGSIVRASNTENEDLFWGLRGAGQNFGVVTQFTLKAYSQGPVYAGPIILPVEKLADVIAFTNNFHKSNTGDEAFWFGAAGAAPNVPHPVIFCMVFKNGSQAEGEAFFKPLLDMGPLAVLATEMPYYKANDMVPNRDEEMRRLQGGANFVLPLDDTFVKGIVDEFNAYVTEKKIALGSMVMFEVLPYNKIKEVPRDATAFPSRGDFYHCATMFSWEDEALDGDVRKFSRHLLDQFRKRGYQGAGGRYTNYEGEGDPNSAFGDNLEKLRELKKKYDPDNVFWKWHSLWPKQEVPN